MDDVITPSSDRHENRFVFLYGPMAHGGIETMILRVANYLARQGRMVDVCINPGGDLEGLFDAQVTIRHYQQMSLLRDHLRRMQSADDRPIILLSFDSSSAARGVVIASEFGKRAALHHVTGVFHPTDYFMPGQPWDRVWLNARIARSLLPHSMFFMNQECRDAHAAWLQMDLADAAIIPLPVDAADAQWQPGGGGVMRIVSVGRLVDFKAYNLGAPFILRQLLDAGVDATWDIYGYGDLEPVVRDAAISAGVDDNLRLCGKLEYAQFHELAKNYDVFVGMGTAAVESAMSGLPTIVATVGEQRGSHGFMHDLPFGNVGERIHGRSLRDMCELLLRYSEMSPDERSALSERGKRAVAGFTVEDFVSRVESFEQKKRSEGPSVSEVLWAKVFFSVTEGWIQKHFLGRGWKRRILGLVRTSPGDHQGSP